MKNKLIVLVATFTSCTVFSHFVYADVWGVKSHDPFSEPPATLFHFEEDGSGLTSVGIITLGGSQIDVDGMAMNSSNVLYGFRVAGSESELVIINTSNAVATSLGTILPGRDIRGAAVTATGKLYALDTTDDEILEINPLTGAITGLVSSLSIDVSNETDITQRNDGRFIINNVDTFYLFDDITENICLLHRDTEPTDGSATLGTSGIAFSQEADSLSTLFMYDVHNDDDIYHYQTNSSFNRTLLYPNVISSYNAGRGDLAAPPVPVNNILQADTDYDDLVGVQDLQRLATHWLEPHCGRALGDLNGDDFVDLFDYFLLAEYWLQFTN